MQASLWADVGDPMIKITMPQAGQTMEEGMILSWKKSEGEPVEKGETLLEIDTDKATIEVEAPENGVLRKILCQDGTTVPVLAPIAILAGPTEDISRQLAEAVAELRSIMGGGAPVGCLPAEKDTEQQELAVAPSPSDSQPPNPILPPLLAPQRIRVSPLARRIAKDRALDLGGLGPGSGPGGRIVAADIARIPASAAASPELVRRPMSGMRSAIARNLVASKQTIPHFYMRLTIDAGPLQVFHRAERTKYPCTITDVIVLACARVMVEFPALRSRIAGEDLIETPGANIGLAVGMEDGLRVPVLVGAERMSLRQVTEQTRRMIEAAQQGTVEAMGQGVFTISNLGMYGIEEFSAIINPPEAAILAVGAIRESVIVKDEALRPGRVMTMTLSADHRIIDGLVAASFLGRLKEMLESPDSLSQ